MESFFTRYKNALVLMVVLLAQVVLLAMQVRRPAPDLPEGHNVRLWRYVVAEVVTPPERLAHNIGLSLRGVWSNYVYLHRLRQQNLALQDENDRLRLEQASLAEDAREGQRLRNLLDFRGRYIDKTVPAQVIGTAGTDQAHTIYIDKGFNDGLRVQMPVITPDGIIGKIKNVFPHTAQVLLISDQTSGAGVMLESTRIRGVMKGNASGQPQMINISPDERIMAGEAVLTSGGDQVYPRGLPVGTVQSVAADPDTSYVNVVIKPNANLAKLEEVMVVTEFSGKMPFSQEKDMMQSEVDALALKQRAADVLSEKLPSLRDPNAAEIDADAEAGAGDPARPVRPPQPIHPDRYTPGASPSAAGLVPGAAPPVTHRVPAVESNAPVVSRLPKSAAGATGNAAVESTREAAPLNRFPPKAVSPADRPAAMASATAAPRPAPAATGASGSPPKPARVPATGAGLSLPLQPADANAAKRAASALGGGAAASGEGSAGMTRAPRPVTAVPAATSGSVPGQAKPTTSAAPSTFAGRRIVDPADNGGGILAPVGMGQIGGSPRPRAATPTASPAASAAQPPPGTRPATVPTKPASSKTLPPGSPAPAVRPPSQTPPPGGE